MNRMFLNAGRGRQIRQAGLGAIAVCLGLEVGRAEPTTLHLDDGWMMMKGDDPDWSRPDLNDSEWSPTQIGVPWEEAGFSDHDGFAWYRVRFVVPEAWQAHPRVRAPDGFLILTLGWIDDVDVSYFNGDPIGRTGRMPPAYVSAYDQERTYKVPVAQVKWGHTNTLAVRVFDGEGPGGMYQGPVVLRPPTLTDYLDLAVQPAVANGIFPSTGPIVLSCKISSEWADSIPLRLEGMIQGDSVTNPPVIQRLHQDLTLPTGDPLSTSLEFRAPGPGFFRVTCRLMDGETSLISQTRIVGVAPEDLSTALTREPDFDAFWIQRKQELAAVEPAFTMTESDHATDDLAVYLVEMRSYGGVRIRGWYSVPRTPGPHPAILHLPGYSGTMEPMVTVTGMASFALNPRGHGNSKDDLDPGDGEYMYLGLDPDHPERYVYVGAYLDTVRAIDFLNSRPEIDAARIGVTGGSQGGGLTFAAAALNPRVAFCMPDIPWLGDWVGYTACAEWAIEEFPKLAASDPALHPAALQRILSYVDTMNLADRIRCPVLMSVGLQDDVCPPRIAFGTYNQVTSQKSYRVYPDLGHQVNDAHQALKQRWAQEHIE